MQLKLDLSLPISPPPADEPGAVQLTGESSPPKWAQSPTMADDVLVLQCLKKPVRPEVGQK